MWRNLRYAPIARISQLLSQQPLSILQAAVRGSASILCNKRLRSPLRRAELHVEARRQCGIMPEACKYVFNFEPALAWSDRWL